MKYDTYSTGQHWSDILLEVDLVQKGHVGQSSFVSGFVSFFA